MKRVAYEDYTQPSGFWVFKWKPDITGPGVAERVAAEQDPWALGTTRRFDEGWSPHLRGDSTRIPSY